MEWKLITVFTILALGLAQTEATACDVTELTTLSVELSKCSTSPINQGNCDEAKAVLSCYVRVIGNCTSDTAFSSLIKSYTDAVNKYCGTSVNNTEEAACSASDITRAAERAMSCGTPPSFTSSQKSCDLLKTYFACYEAAIGNCRSHSSVSTTLNAFNASISRYCAKSVNKTEEAACSASDITRAAERVMSCGTPPSFTSSQESCNSLKTYLACYEAAFGKCRSHSSVSTTLNAFKASISRYCAKSVNNTEKAACSASDITRAAERVMSCGTPPSFTSSQESCNLLKTYFACYEAAIGNCRSHSSVSKTLNAFNASISRYCAKNVNNTQESACSALELTRAAQRLMNCGTPPSLTSIQENCDLAKTYLACYETAFGNCSTHSSISTTLNTFKEEISRFCGKRVDNAEESACSASELTAAVHRSMNCDPVPSLTPSQETCHSMKTYFVCYEAALGNCRSHSSVSTTLNALNASISRYCAKKCYDGRVTPYSADVRKYLHCTGGKWEVKDCPESQFYLSILRKCVQGHRVLIQCPEGRYYNNNLRMCVFYDWQTGSDDGKMDNE